MADSMLLIIAVTLIAGTILAGFTIYTKTVVVEARADTQLDHLKDYSCEEIVKKHLTAHYLTIENKQYASQKVKSCENKMK